MIICKSENIFNDVREILTQLLIILKFTSSKLNYIFGKMEK